MFKTDPTFRKSHLHNAMESMGGAICYLHERCVCCCLKWFTAFLMHLVFLPHGATAISGELETDLSEV